MKTHNQVNMIGNATDTKTFALPVADDGGEIRMQTGANGIANQGATVFCAEDQMDQQEAQRLGHGDDYKSGLQPSTDFSPYTWGFAPGWYEAAPLALSQAIVRTLSPKMKVVCTFPPKMTVIHALALSLTIVSALASGCKSSTSPVRPSPTPVAAAYPTRPTVPPPPFKVFHHDASSFTLVTQQDTTDSEIEALIWQLHDAARTQTFDQLKIDQKVIDARDPIIWFHLYRGPKCASEKYTTATLPCGASYHAAGDYTFGGFKDPQRDDGVLLYDEDHEVHLWNPDAPQGLKPSS